MLIDMKGYKVVYDDKAYKCLAIEEYSYTGPYNVSGVMVELRDSMKLKVYIINHDSQFDILDGFNNEFAFLKDEKWGK